MKKRFKIALALVALIPLALVAGYWLYIKLPVHNIPAAEPIDEWVYLDQGWGEGAAAPDRQLYYYTPQGAMLPQGQIGAAVRYDWFIHLEMPDSEARFADPEHMRRYRFLVDPEPTAANPHQLPVGFAKHFEPQIGANVLDITCAACHSGQILAEKDGKTVAIRIDGGQAMHAFTDIKRGDFATTLIASLISTRFMPGKFNRFADKVLGEGASDVQRGELRDQIMTSIKGFLGEGQNNPLRHLYPTQEGFGRTDALGRIANTVFGDHLVSANYQVADAPVSYPYVWDIWKFDWVQYNASVSQPLARNIGEALGVGATIALVENGKPVPEDRRYATSVRVDDLTAIEHNLRKLTPPSWPADYLGAVDRDLAAEGKPLFAQHCQGCHGPHLSDRATQVANAPGKVRASDEWRIPIIPIDEIGTDPNEAVGFVERRYDLSATGMTLAQADRVLRPQQNAWLLRQINRRLTEVINAADDATLIDQASQWQSEIPNLQQANPPIPGVLLQTIASSWPTIQPKTAPDHGACALACQQAALKDLAANGQDRINDTIDSVDIAALSEGQALNLIGLFIKQRYFANANLTDEQRQCVQGFGTLDLPQQVAGYKPRPLQGVWATPPFLHNGSVPSIHELLLPPQARSQRFFVGRRLYDPVKLGYVTEPVSDDEKDGFWLDTSISGNHNSGHAFDATPEQWAAFEQDRDANPLPKGTIGPKLSDAERAALLEYLKIHVDEPVNPIPTEGCDLPSTTVAFHG